MIVVTDLDSEGVGSQKVIEIVPDGFCTYRFSFIKNQYREEDIFKDNLNCNEKLISQIDSELNNSGSSFLEFNREYEDSSNVVVVRKTQITVQFKNGNVKEYLLMGFLLLDLNEAPEELLGVFEIALDIAS